MFENSKWIWVKNGVSEINEYADFISKFNYNGGVASIFISAESDYSFYINGKFIGFHQFPDYPDEKAYDEYDITEFLTAGENLLAVQVCGKNYDTCNHCKNGKGLIFEITENGNIICVSDERTLSRVSKTYRSGDTYNITVQLSKSFYYDFNGVDGFINGKGLGFTESVESLQKTEFFPRPIDRLKVTGNARFKPIKGGLYDGEKERVGYLYFDIDSDDEREVVLSYGEHILDGDVRRKIDGRDFSVTFKLVKGKNVFTGYYLRFGARYLSFDDNGLTVNEIGLLTAEYPHTKIEYTDGVIPKDIYDVSVYTLECCMHDYYEDCPWREQGQYSMDSRTQLLCGYYAFNETALAASAIRTMTHRLTAKGVFPLTAPCLTELSITTFSMIMPLIVAEYYEFTGDKSVVVDTFNNVKFVIDNYSSQMIDGLMPCPAEWNFFEWEEGLHNDWQIENQVYRPDLFALPTNAFLIVGLENLAKLCNVVGVDGNAYLEQAQKIKKRARAVFYGTEGLYNTYFENGKKHHLAEYTQVMALYSGIASEAQKPTLLKTLTSKNDLLPLAISNYVFKYEALLNESGYEQFIVDEIKDKWGYMLSNGATTFWETLKGAEDFGGAGSLCHGWSAVPIIVAWKLKNR